MVSTAAERRAVAAQTMRCFPQILGAVGDTLVPSIKATKFYQKTEPLLPLRADERKTTKYVLHNGDTVDTACALKRQGLNPLVLNLASELNPGGGWSNGALAQEECIFLRSTYDLSLNGAHNIDQGRMWRYPIALTGGIYSPVCSCSACFAKYDIRHMKLTEDNMTPTHSIPLRNNLKEVVAHALVDESDHDLVSSFEWHLHATRNKTYAQGSRKVADGVRSSVMMHILLLGKPQKGLVIDHMDGDGLLSYAKIMSLNDR